MQTVIEIKVNGLKSTNWQYCSHRDVKYSEGNTGSGTNKAHFLLQNLLLQNHKHVILQHNNITLKHTI